MECAEIRERLSEYVDDILEGEMKAAVEKHLLTCEGCQAEFAELKALIDDLKSFESLEAPRDFLDTLHARLEPSYRLGKLMRILFVPIRIKVPLEFATVAAIAILILSLWHIPQEEKRIAQAPEGLSPALSGQKGEVDIVKIAPEVEPYRAKASFAKETARQRDEGRETIQLALLLEVERPKEPYAPISETEAVPAPQEQERLAEEEVPHAASPSTKRVAAKGVQDAREKRDERKLPGQTAELQPEERSASEDQAESAVSYLDTVFSRVRELVLLSGGKIAAMEYDAETDRPRSIRAEIPARRYSFFVAKLEQVAPLQTPSPSISETDQEAIQVRISFVSPE